jgi:hypothetical protein
MLSGEDLRLEKIESFILSLKDNYHILNTKRACRIFKAYDGLYGVLQSISAPERGKYAKLANDALSGLPSHSVLVLIRRELEKTKCTSKACRSEGESPKGKKYI